MKTLAAMRLKTAALRGLKTAWLDNGNIGKDILLLLHGYPNTPGVWSAQVEAFGEDYRLLLPFGRGVGESQPPADRRRYGVHSILLDHIEILRLADPEGRTPVHVVGHDIGGVHAWMLASHPNARLKTVTILNSAHPRQYLRRLLWPRQVFKSWYISAFQIPYLAEALVWLFHKEILGILAAEGWQPPASELTLKNFEGAAINAINFYRQFARDIPLFLREKAAPTPVPVLVISSEEDRYLEAPSTLEFSDIAKDVTVRVVKGAHWVHREQPERINRLLADFWSRGR